MGFFGATARDIFDYVAWAGGQGAVQQDLQGLKQPVTKEGLKNYAKGAAAGAVGLPVDLASMAMRPFGYDVPPEQTFGSTEWIGKKLGADTRSGPFTVGAIGSPSPDDFLKAMTLFHGSPHLFDAFKLNKIGTGEGAQAYGHGLYFAESPGVAGGYAKRLSAQKGGWTNQVDMLTVGNKKLRDVYDIETDAGFATMIESGDMAAAQKYAVKKRDRWAELAADPEYPHRGYAKEKIGAWNGVALDVADGKVSTTAKGALYEVDIPDEAVNKMLDWDKPLSEQPDALKKLKWLAESPDSPLTGNFAQLLRESLQSFELGNTTGGTVVRLLGGDEVGSKILLEAGIPGIKYLDGTSRTAGEGTRNIVLFDENLVKILNRK